MNHTTFFIVLSVVSEAGFGLLALLGLVGNAHGKASSELFAYTGVGVALLLISALPFAQVFGNALSTAPKVRGSLFLPKTIAAFVTYVAALVFAALWSGRIDAPQLIALAGVLTAIACATTMLCTAMIDAQHQMLTPPQTRLAVPTHIVFSLACGSTLLNVISFIFGRFQTNAGIFMAGLTVLLILIAASLSALKSYFRGERNARSFGFALLGAGLLSTLLALLWPWMVLIAAPVVIFAAVIYRRARPSVAWQNS